MPRAGLLVLAGVLALLTGCGGSHTRPFDVTTPVAPAGHTFASYPAAGVVLRHVPANWHVQPGHAPLVTTITSGDATLAVWRYPRTQPLPRTPTALQEALAALITTVQGRDHTFKLLTSKTERIDHRPSIVLVGDDTIDGNARTTRSTHVFAYGAEVVLDAYAPARVFERVDRSVFLPIVHSIRLRRP